MHQLMGADDSIDWTGSTAMGTANAQRFIDNGDRTTGRNLFNQRNDCSTEQVCEPAHCFLAARRAEVDIDAILGDCSRIRATTRITALRALRLWQQVIDLIHNCGLFCRQ